VPRRWILWSLFLSSYTPLFILLGVRSIGRSDGIAVAAGVLTVGGMVGTGLFLYTAPRKAAGDYELVDIESRDGDVGAYAATYLLPFLTIFSGSWQDVVSLAGFVVILGVVYVRSRLIYINPFLAVLGLRLWRVIPRTPGAPDSEQAGWPRFLLTDSTQLHKGQVIRAHRVTADLLFCEVEDDGGDGD
jgi:hypothetical protein